MTSPRDCSSALQLVAALKRKVMSPSEVIKWYLDRIARFDTELRSAITVCAEEALADAARADRALMKGEELPVLFGLPLGVKDQFWTRGIRTTSGSRAFRDLVPSENATAIDRLRAAGAIVVSKLNMGELALGTTQRPEWGHPKNPWHPDHRSGESSSGAAVALAADLCGAALGEDTGGSARTPAAFCGVVGLRPTYGRVSRYGMSPMCWFMDTAAPMAKTVEDAAVVLGVIAGHDSRDPYTSRSSVPDYERALQMGIRGIRVGVIRELRNGEELHPLVRSAQDSVLEVLLQLGATVTEVSIPLLRLAGPIFSGTALVEAAAANRELLRTRSADLDSASRMRLQASALIPASVNDLALRARVLLSRQILSVFESVDIITCATAPYPAPKREVVSVEFERSEDARRNYVSGHALAGVPVISVPCGSVEGLPIGIQFAGRHFEESLVLRVAHAYEQATPWHTMRSPIARA